MSSKILIHRFYNETQFGTGVVCTVTDQYIMKNFHLPVDENYMRIYVFCRAVYEDFVKGLLVQYCRPKTSVKRVGVTIHDIAEGHVSIHQFSGCAVPIMTNSNILSFVASHGTDDLIQYTTAFAITFRKREVRNRVWRDLRDNQILNPYYTFMPHNIEMELIMSAIFDVSCIESVDQQYNEIKRVQLQSFTPEFIKKKMGLIMPLQKCLCFIEGDLLLKSLPSETSENNKLIIDSYIKDIPKIMITLVMSDERSPFKLTTAIEQVHITVAVDDDIFNYSIVTCTPGLESLVPQSIDGVFISRVENEAQLLNKFIELYCKGVLFDLASITLHWMVNINHEHVFVRILDRIMINHMYPKISEYCTMRGDLILLNKNCIVLPLRMMTSSEPEASLSLLAPRYYQATKILADTKPEFVRALMSRLSPEVARINLDVTVIKYASLGEYGGPVIGVAGPGYFIRETVRLNSEWLRRHLPKSYGDLIDVVNRVKVSLFELHTLTPAVGSFLTLFYHYLSEGVLLLKSNTPDASRCAIRQYLNRRVTKYTTLSGADVSMEEHNHMEVFTKRLPTLVSLVELGDLMRLGGIIRTQYSITTEHVISLDFKSYYPTIISIFSLDFNNQCIVTGFEYLNLVPNVIPAEYINYIQLWSIYTYKRIIEREQVVETDLYLLILPELDKHAKLPLQFRNVFNRYLSSEKNKLDKQIYNGIIGCLKQRTFKYKNSSLFGAVHFFGQRIMLFLDVNMDNLVEHFRRGASMSNMLELWENFELCSYKGPGDGEGLRVGTISPSARSICNINTDGFAVVGIDEERTNEFVNFINRHIKMVFENGLVLKRAYTTNFLIDYGKSMYVYRDTDGVFRGSNPAQINQALCLQVMENLRDHINRRLSTVKELDISNFDFNKNYRIVMLYYYISSIIAKYKTNTTIEHLEKQEFNFSWIMDFVHHTRSHYIDVLNKNTNCDLNIRQLCNVFYNKIKQNKDN